MTRNNVQTVVASLDKKFPTPLVGTILSLAAFLTYVGLYVSGALVPVSTVVSFMLAVVAIHFLPPLVTTRQLALGPLSQAIAENQLGKWAGTNALRTVLIIIAGPTLFYLSEAYCTVGSGGARGMTCWETRGVFSGYISLSLLIGLLLGAVLSNLVYVVYSRAKP